MTDVTSIAFSEKVSSVTNRAVDLRDERIDQSCVSPGLVKRCWCDHGWNKKVWNEERQRALTMVES